MIKALQERPQGALPSNTIPNPREEIKAITTRSGNVLAGPLVPPPSPSSSKEVERDPKTITDQVLPESTTHVPHPIVQPSPISRSFDLPSPVSLPSEPPKWNPHQPPIPYPSRLNKEKLQDKSDIQVHKFFQMFKKLHFNISLVEALALMPKYHKMLKDLLSDKEKLLGLVNTSLIENCSAVLLKKLLEKLGDPGKFLIPCDFPKLEKCMALADLGANINLMPLSVRKKLMLPKLVPTRKFTFSADFFVVDYNVDPRVPIILGRPFLRKACALVDVYGEELILRDRDEKLIFHAESTSTHPHKHGNESINMINFIDITCEDRFQEVLKNKKSNHPYSGSTTSPSDSFPSLTSFETSDYLLGEFADELALLDPFPSGNEDDNFDPEADLREIEYLLNRALSTDSSPKTDIDIIDPILERFTDELTLKNEKDKNLKMECLIDDMDDEFFPLLPTSDLTLLEESSEIATLLSSPFGNEDKVLNPGKLILGGTQIFNDESKDKDLKVNTSSEA
ncbi:hypothetical protein Tco_1199673, partial [Tanacetum coccineum]